jgi:hypothetical protein
MERPLRGAAGELEGVQSWRPKASVGGRTFPSAVQQVREQLN